VNSKIEGGEERKRRQGGKCKSEGEEGEEKEKEMER
jgi:hypothetical protein